MLRLPYAPVLLLENSVLSHQKASGKQKVKLARDVERNFKKNVGSLPGGTLKDSETILLKSVELAPDKVLTHYELAITYLDLIILSFFTTLLIVYMVLPIIGI